MSKKGGPFYSAGTGSSTSYLPTSKTRTYILPRRTVTRRAPFALLILAALVSYIVLYTTIPSSTPSLSSFSAHEATSSGSPFGRLDVPPTIPLPDPNDPNPAVLVKAKHGAVATEHHTCSQIGVDVLKEGGNAIDAGIASTLCIGVVSMFSAGIGGGGFMTVRVPSTNGSGYESWTIDFRETAPAAARSDMYVGKPNESRVGGLSVGVPGELMGLHEAHTRWGKLPWVKLVAPARDLAAAFPVGRELGRRLSWFAPLFEQAPDWQPIFAPSGKVLKEGEIMRRTNLSRTLGIIGEEGIGPFYNGSIARSTVSKTQATGGILTMEDMANYSVIVAPALEGPFMGRKVYVPGAPTSGPVLLHMLRLAEKLGLGEEDGNVSPKELGRRVHLAVECMKFGFAARTRVCDPAFSDDVQRMERIPTEEYADAVFKNVTDDRTHEAGYYQPEYDVKVDHGTSHISAYSVDGTAASITSTVNLLFGSQVLDPETGIILNDEMDDFSTPGQPNAFGLYPSPNNYPAPFKRPLSSTVPALVESSDGNFELAIGGSGGSRIFGAVFLTLLNLVSGRDGDVLGAVERGRVHDQLFPAVVDVDSTVGIKEVEGLRERGHNVSVSDRGGVKAVVNAVYLKEGVVYAASDSRKNGIAAGW